MVKSFINLISIICFVYSCITSAIGQEVNADELPKVKVTMLLEHEGFLTWYAKENGWDKKLGFEIDLSICDVSGVEIMNQHNADPKSWNITSVSSTPLITANNNSSFEIIGLANDESISTQVFVRPNSNILKHRGWNADYPNVYGSPETIAGKTFYVKRMTSSEYVLSKWLEIFDLDFSDIVLIDKPGMDSVEAMNKGSGEGMALWSPATFDAEKEGYKSVTSARMAEAEIPLMIVADKEYAQNNEELVAKFLAVYLQAVNSQQDGYKKLVKAYQRFLKQYTDKDYPEEFCLYDLRNHYVFDLDRQLELFATKGHRKSIIKKLERNITSSMVLFLNDSTSDEKCSPHKVKSPRNISDKYLKLAEPYLKKLND
ncbi:ABC transporter substrate-binding protein [Succinivibrio dextrinosolvens]|jgi:NitT/TauT family transport system substrate-binding protein/sulfonate transport system substrate-binding protein|uniref:ABC transporter substrate-binding protein n=1 Tax=Succinivibrio dextrinosolvens TaxID=83771 RepID=UPI0004E20F7B|nr:ABC transporter substrate-binding protein [Succinivibrio dextrinosolvens]